MIHDSRRRSIAKSITWRIAASLTTAGIVLIFTKSLKFAVTIGAVEMILKMFIYYAHERLWSHSEWGMK